MTVLIVLAAKYLYLVVAVIGLVVVDPPSRRQGGSRAHHRRGWGVGALLIVVPSNDTDLAHARSDTYSRV